jgi:hypothetical protein
MSTCRVLPCVALLAAVVAVGGCTGGPSKPSAASGGDGGATSAAPVTRWWSNSAEQAKTVIDAGNPAAAARKLKPSRTEYCGMLADTLAAGRSVLSGVSADDPQLATATKAFVAELTSVAPTELRADWTTVGGAMVALVDAKTSAAHVDSAKVSAAVTAIGADAKAHCNLDLSRTK